MPARFETDFVVRELAARAARGGSAPVTLREVRTLLRHAHGHRLMQAWRRDGIPDTYEGLFGPVLKAMGRRVTLAKLAACDQALRDRGLVLQAPLTLLLRGASQVLVTAV